MTGLDVSVVLPVYNEVENLGPLHEETRDVLEAEFETWEMLFVDDGSTDGSYRRLVDLHERDARVKVLRLGRNFGQSAALDAGTKQARGDLVVTMDADGQNDPADIPRLVEALRAEDLDCVVGWRRNREDPFTKAVASRLARWMRRAVLDTELHDYGCTLKVFTSEAANAIDIKGEMHRYVPPILKWRGFAVGEVEVNHRSRTEGETKYGWYRLPKGFMDMINVWFWQKYSGRPIHIFGGLGIVAGTVGAFGGFYSVYLKLVENVSLSDTALPLFSVFMILLGIQFFISGILADISVRNYFQLRESTSYRIRDVHGRPEATPATAIPRSNLADAATVEERPAASVE